MQFPKTGLDITINLQFKIKSLEVFDNITASNGKRFDNRNQFCRLVLQPKLKQTGKATDDVRITGCRIALNVANGRCDIITECYRTHPHEVFLITAGIFPEKSFCLLQSFPKKVLASDPTIERAVRVYPFSVGLFMKRVQSRGFRLAQNIPAVQPPSMARADPVTKAASSLARYNAAKATSSGLPMRPIA